MSSLLLVLVVVLFVHPCTIKRLPHAVYLAFS
jgi:hypothetical protein